MEIDVKDIPWPVSVIRSNEAILRLTPGEDLTIIAADPDVVHNIVLLVKSQPDLQFNETRKSKTYRIRVRRKGTGNMGKPKVCRRAETQRAKRSP